MVSVARFHAPLARDLLGEHFASPSLTAGPAYVDVVRLRHEATAVEHLALTVRNQRSVARCAAPSNDKRHALVAEETGRVWGATWIRHGRKYRAVLPALAYNPRMAPLPTTSLSLPGRPQLV